MTSYGSVRSAAVGNKLNGRENKTWLDHVSSFKASGLFAMLGSAACFAATALLVKMLPRFNKFELVFWRSLLMSIAGLVVCFWRRINPLGPSMDVVPTVLLRGTLGLGFMISFFAALKYLPLGDTIAISYTSPMMTSISAVFVLGEPMSVIDGIGMLLCLVGVVLVAKPTFATRNFGGHETPLPAIGVVSAVGAALCSTSVWLLLRFAKKIDPQISTNYVAFVGLIASPWLCFFLVETVTSPAEITLKEWAFLLALSLLTVLAQNLLSLGLSLETAGRASAMQYSQIVFSFLAQVAILHQPCDPWSILGSTLITICGGIVVLKEGDHSSTEKQTIDENKSRPNSRQSTECSLTEQQTIENKA